MGEALARPGLGAAAGRADPTGADQPDRCGVKSDQEFLVFGEPQILEEEIQEVVACLRSGWIGTGPRVARFEQDFAAFKGVERAVAVASCSAGLHLSLLTLGIEPGDEIITSPLTFCGTVNAIIHAGGRPVLADIDPVTMNLDPRQVEPRLTPRTRAIVPVHFAGRCCDMKALAAIYSRRGLSLIEDCAHALEAEYHGKAAGTFGDFGCFSFYATKNVTTGEGGMVTARRAADLNQIRSLAFNGMTKDAWARVREGGNEQYCVHHVGLKYNMMDLQAAIGIHQLRRVAANWRRRREIWVRYLEAFASLPISLPAAEEPGTRHAHHLFTVTIDARRAGITRDEFLKTMAEFGIGLGVHYLSVPEHPIYRDRFGWRPEEWPAAHTVGRQTVSLPLSQKLTDQDVERVIRAVYKTLRVT
jgi:dTDP-4-amino-4,6-dideoxygalactose transaminase